MGEFLNRVDEKDMVECPECNGRGVITLILDLVPLSTRCKDCKGMGKVNENKTKERG